MNCGRWSALCSRSGSAGVSSVVRRCHRTRYVVVLPEIPDATIETNGLMRTASSNSLPSFNSLTLRECMDGSAKMALEFESWVRRHCQKLGEINQLDLDFRSVIEEVEMHLAPVQYAGGTSRLLAGVKYFRPDIIPRLRGLQNLLCRARASRFSDDSYFGMVRRLMENGELDGSQKALLGKYMLEFKLNGLELSGRKRLWIEEYRRRLYDVSFKFRRNVEMASSQLNLTLDPSVDLDEAPDHLIESWSQNKNEPRKGLFVLSFSPSVYQPFLRYCRQRPSRGAIWKAFNSRAGFEENVVQLNNSMHIEELRNARQGLATSFGFDCYASMVMHGRMAKSLEDVEHMIVSLKDVVVPWFAEQCREMEELRASVDLVRTPLRPWDVDYYARKLAERKHDISFNAISEYFPYSHVMPTLLSLLESMFEVKFSNVSEKVERWADAVEVYEVLDERGAPLGHLFIDPFISSKKLPACWSECGRARSDVIGYTPIVYLHLNLSSTNIRGLKPALFHWDHLVNLFREIGRSLQLLLTRMPFLEMASGETLERDCVMVVPYVLENLLMMPQCLSAISGHCATGSKLSIEQALSFRRAIQATQMPMLVRSLFKSDFDLLIHKSNMNFWFDMYRDKSKEYFPFGWEKGDYRPCNNLLVADEQAAASTYMQLWSEVVACDLIESAGDITNGIGDASFLQFCSRFKRYYLTVDGSVEQCETFRRFTGRSSPNIKGLLKSHFLVSN
uniref:Peptidase_M3 domain-containing protein n=1 Tax=Trichuris muris TaxID=70415 RepID=A0A5S6QYI3_TRIMR